MKGGESVFSTSLSNLKAIQQQNDRARLVRDLNAAQEDLNLARKLLQTTSDRWEFESIQQDISSLEWKIHQLQCQINDRTLMSSIERFNTEVAQTVITAFNNEAATANQAYTEALGEIERAAKQLNQQLTTKLPMLNEIERKAAEVNGLSMYLTELDTKQLESFRAQRIRKSNFQIVTISQHLSAVQQLLNEMEGV